MSASLFRLHSEFRPWAEALVNVARQYNLAPRVTSTFRSIDEQEKLYRRYLAGSHPYPVAPPGQSLHNYGLAFDMISNNNEWLGAVWRHWGGQWSSSDDVHFSI